MTRLIPLAAVAIAAVTLGACSTQPQTRTAAQPTIVTVVHPYYPGTGVVQAVMATPAMARASATPVVAGSGAPVVAGATGTPVVAAAGSSSERMQRLEIKMDNGKIQYIDTPSRDFSRGMRVILTEDKLIRPV